MRDAFGGTVTLVIVSVFIVIALGYMAFNVNYTKAFRMKDKIISLYEDFDGECGTTCQDAIRSYAQTLGYANDNTLNCDRVGDGYHMGANNLYCYKEEMEIRPQPEGSLDDRKEKHYFKIVTKINIKIPIISNIFDFRIFYITGDTKTFEIPE